MPALVVNYQEKATVTKVKKYYSILSQAYAMAEQEYGSPEGWDLIANNSPQGAQNMAEKFKPYLRVINETTNTTDSVAYIYSLSDGSTIRFEPRSANCTSSRGSGKLQKTCGLIYLGAQEKDATSGVNLFGFVLTSEGMVPFGTPEETSRPFSTNCAATKGGLGCTAWVLINENMDYLHCDDLSWDGKAKCD